MQSDITKSDIEAVSHLVPQSLVSLLLAEAEEVAWRVKRVMEFDTTRPKQQAIKGIVEVWGKEKIAYFAYLRYVKFMKDELKVDNILSFTYFKMGSKKSVDADGIDNSSQPLQRFIVMEEKGIKKWSKLLDEKIPWVTFVVKNITKYCFLQLEIDNSTMNADVDPQGLKNQSPFRFTTVKN